VTLTQRLVHYEKLMLDKLSAYAVVAVAKKIDSHIL